MFQDVSMVTMCALSYLLKSMSGCKSLSEKYDYVH